MRQGNSNKRMRGRGGSGSGGGGGNNGPRKGPNPLSRSYESTGPDVKIRGTALHIAEKYVSLARDAQSSGDPVLAESYLQHAEHYYRVIAAAQASMPQPMTVVRSDIQHDDDDDDGDESYAETRFDTRGRAGDMRSEANGNMDTPRPERQERPERAERPERPERQERPERGERPERSEPRGYEGRAVEPRAVEVRGGGDAYMPADAPQPFVDDVPVDRALGGDDRRPGPGRGRFRTGGRGDFRADAPRGDAPRAEGARPPRERPARGEGRFEPREPREPRVAAAEAAPREAPVESNLDALPAFLTAAPPRASVAAMAAAAVAAAAKASPDAGEDETPRRRTRGGRGRGRRPEFEGAEGAAPEAAAPAVAED